MSSDSGSTGGHNIYLILNETSNKFKHLTNSNDCPTEDEATELRKGLTIAVDYLYKFRTRRQSLRLNNEAKKARQEEKAILRIIQNHRAVLSPVRRVPTEIWEEIFIYCGEQTGLCTPVDPCHIKIEEFPWVLGRVCSRWRGIIMDTPTLWTNVRINLSAYYLCDSRRQPMETVIQRSKMVPIHLRIQSDPNVAQATVMGVAMLLFDLRDRFESLTFVMPFEHFQLMQAEIKPSALTVLKQLHLEFLTEFNSSNKNYFQKDDVHVFTTAPQLKQVTISGGGADFPDKFNLPWSQLEVVEQYLARDDQVLQCISNCPNMQTLFVYETYGMRTDLAILRHDVLRCVTLGEVLLLDYLELPSLIELTVGYNSTLRSPFNEYAAKLERFLGRCGSNLETLVIGHIPFENKGLVPILKQTPRLKEFKIECGYRMSSLAERALIRDLISSLSIQEDLLPFLEELHICVRYEETMVAVVDDQLCRVLDSRVGQRTHFTPLHSFFLHVRDADELTFGSGVSPHCVDFLMGLSVRVGVDLEIGCPGKGMYLI